MGVGDADPLPEVKPARFIPRGVEHCRTDRTGTTGTERNAKKTGGAPWWAGLARRGLSRL